LPEDGRFTISDRTFPDDGIRVLQEFTAALDAQNIRYDALLRGDATKSRRRPAKGGTKASEDASPNPSPSKPPEQAAAPKPANGNAEEPLFSLNPREHIAVLTGGGREN